VGVEVEMLVSNACKILELPEAPEEPELAPPPQPESASTAHERVSKTNL